MEVLLYFLTGAGIGGLLTYLSTRIGRKGMEVNLRILQEKAESMGREGTTMAGRKNGLDPR